MGDVIRIYDGQDPRDLPNYTIGEVAAYLGIPPTTLRAWVKGMGTSFKRIIRLPDPKQNSLSFLNVVEAHVLHSLREVGPRFQEIRKAVTFVERKLGKARPLATEAFYTDGVSVFVDELGRLIDVSREGQTAMRDAVCSSLKRVDYAGDGIAARLYPFTRAGLLSDPRAIVFDPLVSFGRPVIAGTGVPTEEVADRFNAGESLEELADDFGVPMEKVQEAIRCEFHRKRSAA